MGLATRWKICAVTVWTQMQTLHSNVKIYFKDYRGDPLLNGASWKPLERSSCTKRHSGPDSNGTGNTM